MRFLLRQSLDHLCDSTCLCTIRFLVCGIRERVKAAEEPELLEITDQCCDVLCCLDLFEAC